MSPPKIFDHICVDGYRFEIQDAEINGDAETGLELNIPCWTDGLSSPDFFPLLNYCFRYQINQQC